MPTNLLGSRALTLPEQIPTPVVYHRFPPEVIDMPSQSISMRLRQNTHTLLAEESRRRLLCHRHLPCLWMMIPLHLLSLVILQYPWYPHPTKSLKYLVQAVQELNQLSSPSRQHQIPNDRKVDSDTRSKSRCQRPMVNRSPHKLQLAQVRMALPPRVLPLGLSSAMVSRLLKTARPHHPPRSNHCLLHLPLLVRTSRRPTPRPPPQIMLNLLFRSKSPAHLSPPRQWTTNRPTKHRQDQLGLARRGRALVTAKAIRSTKSISRSCSRMVAPMPAPSPRQMANLRVRLRNDRPAESMRQQRLSLLRCPKMGLSEDGLRLYKYLLRLLVLLLLSLMLRLLLSRARSRHPIVLRARRAVGETL